MILSDYGDLTPSELARELLRERDVLLRHSRRMREPRERVAAYERRCGTASADLRDAIERGNLAATDEVCDWIIEYELLLRAQSAKG